MSHFMTMPSFQTLKTHLNCLFRPVKKSTFGVYDPIGIKYLFQLRVGLSPLKSHKKKHMFPDTPNDTCACNAGVEDTEHFMFTCPIYALYRASLAASVVRILALKNLNHLSNMIEIYLYGHPVLSIDDNKNIIISTIKFIKETKRFE